MDQIS